MKTILLVLAPLLFLACRSAEPAAILAATSDVATYEIDEAAWTPSAVANPNTAGGTYFSLAMPFAAASNLKDAVATRTGLTLKDRGEAHVTLLTPPEVTALREHLDGVEILEAIGNSDLQTETVTVICVGSGKKTLNGKVQKTFFAVVDSPGLFARRQAVADAFQAAGGAPEVFAADHFYPHVTLGFTKTDLHEQDGVIKDRRSCIATVD